jgi:hypothetical protein
MRGMFDEDLKIAYKRKTMTSRTPEQLLNRALLLNLLLTGAG